MADDGTDHNSEQTTEPEVHDMGFDPRVASQISLLSMTNALNQQQLNSAMARNMVANNFNVLTLGVQLNHTATLHMLTSTSPTEAAAMDTLIRSGNPARVAAMQAYGDSPQGQP